MLRNYPFATAVLGMSMSTAQIGSVRAQDSKIDKDNQYAAPFIAMFRKAKPLLEEIGIRHCLVGFQQHLNMLENGTMHEEAFRAAIQSFNMALGSELEKLQFLYVRNSEYYKDNGLFGNEVDDRFPKGSAEISEAGKCFALGRYTATVFHLMRVMEYTLRALYKSLKLPAFEKLSDRNWSVILSKISTEIEKRDKNRTVKWNQNRQFVQESYSLLRAVKDHLRDGTMHVEHDYTEESAKIVLDAIRAFMQKIAARIGESGRTVL